MRNMIFLILLKELFQSLLVFFINKDVVKEW